MISRAEGRRSPGSKTPELICARSSAAMVDDEVLTTSSCTRTLNEGKHRSHSPSRSKTATVLVRDCSLGGTVLYVGHHEQKAYTYFRGEHRWTWCVRTGYATTASPLLSSRSRRLRAQADRRWICVAGRTVVERRCLKMPAALAPEQAGISWVDEHGRSRAAISSDDFDGGGSSRRSRSPRRPPVDLLNRRIGDEVEHLFNDTITELAQTPTALTPSSATHRHADLTRYRC